MKMASAMDTDEKIDTKKRIRDEVSVHEEQLRDFKQRSRYLENELEALWEKIRCGEAELALLKAKLNPGTFRQIPRYKFDQDLTLWNPAMNQQVVDGVVCPEDAVQLDNLDALLDESEEKLKTHACIVACVHTVTFDKQVATYESRQRIFGERVQGGLEEIHYRACRYIKVEDDWTIQDPQKRQDRNQVRRGCAEELRQRWRKFLDEHQRGCQCEAQVKKFKLDTLPGVMNTVEEIDSSMRRLAVDPTL